MFLNLVEVSLYNTVLSINLSIELVESLKRGYYRARFEVITDNPAATNPTEITLAYARLLEQNILESPELWLWTHNRWKWSRMNKEG